MINFLDFQQVYGIVEFEANMTEDSMNNIVEDINAPVIYYVFWDKINGNYLLDTKNNYLHVADTNLGVFMVLHCSPFVDVIALPFEDMLELANEFSDGKYTVLDDERIYDGLQPEIIKWAKKTLKFPKKKVKK